MLQAGRSKAGPTSTSTWVFVFLVAISISVDAVMLLGLMSMFPAGQFVAAAFRRRDPSGRVSSHRGRISQLGDARLTSG